MFLEKIHSEGLAHVSYLIGDGAEAAVVDPRRDCDAYAEIARREGVRITRIFETHRNEDYVVGSLDLARRTGAAIHHGAGLDFSYGEAVREGDAFEFGDVRLEVLETPGHTFESISIVLFDKAFPDGPVGVFTGDALFVGDVGRTDFFPDRAEEVAGLLYDSLFEKILPLGDHVIVYPAHGAGSVCGDAMADREFSTVGHEKRNNPALQVNGRDAFIARKVAEIQYQPPYFRKMEEHNQNGAPPMERLPVPPPRSTEEFSEACTDGALQVVDVRSAEAFGGAFVPGSLCLPEHMVAAYGGWFLDYKRPIGLIADDPEEVRKAVTHFARLGYDDVWGFLKGGIAAWEKSGRDYDQIPGVTAKQLTERLGRGEDFTLLDVRKETEFREKHVREATFCFLGYLPDCVEDLPSERPIATFCGSGRRAMIAASYLKLRGFERVENVLGSMDACEAVGCPLTNGD